MFKSVLTAMFLASFVLLAGVASRAQDMTGLDVTSDAFTKSQMSRSDIESAISNLPAGAILDLSGKSSQWPGPFGTRPSSSQTSVGPDQ